MLIDTHCHIHESDYPLDSTVVLQHAKDVGVGKMICVGTSEKSSKDAITFGGLHENIYASIGVHPHDTKDGYDIEGLFNAPRLVAVGEIGLDYFYAHSKREIQIQALEAQIHMALAHNLPIIFHVRDAATVIQGHSVWDDFWPIIDNFHGIRGELHSFTDSQIQLENGLKRDFFIGVNGISTFTKDEAQKAMFTSIPLSKLLLETDAPFLTPAPVRGIVNEPAFVKYVAEHHAAVRNIPLDELAAVTAANATVLFAL
ncbi:MAG: TatD family hydrolase [Candidatus Saccharimonadales bacterium]